MARTERTDQQKIAFAIVWSIKRSIEEEVVVNNEYIDDFGTAIFFDPHDQMIVSLSINFKDYDTQGPAFLKRDFNILQLCITRKYLREVEPRRVVGEMILPRRVAGEMILEILCRALPPNKRPRAVEVKKEDFK